MTTGGWGEAFFYRRAPFGQSGGCADFRDFQPLAVSKNVKIAKGVMHDRDELEG